MAVQRPELIVRLPKILLFPYLTLSLKEHPVGQSKVGLGNTSSAHMVCGFSSSQNVEAVLATKEIRKCRKAVEGVKKSLVICF